MNIYVAKGYAHMLKRQLIRYSKVARRLPVEVQGKKYLQQLLDTSRSNMRIDERTGWMKFNIRKLPQLKDNFTKLQTLAMRCLNEAEARRSSPEASPDKFPINLMLSTDLKEHPEILEFVLDDEFLTPASLYLGQVPRLSELALVWSPCNDTVIRSQKFHYDHRDTRQVKIFLNMNDVYEENGPFSFLPADVCSQFNSKIGYNQAKNDDEIVYSACNREALVNNMGAAGMGLMVDTARCLHYGSRQNKKDRLLLMIVYVLPNCVAPRRSRTLEPVRTELARKLFENDPIRKYVLTVKAL